MFHNYPTSAIVIIGVLSVLVLILLFFVIKYYGKFQKYLDKFIFYSNLAQRRRTSLNRYKKRAGDELEPMHPDE